MTEQSSKEKAGARVAKREFEPGEVIVKQGEVSGKAYLIVSGEVRVVRVEGQREIELAELGPKAF